MTFSKDDYVAYSQVNNIFADKVRLVLCGAYW